MTFISSKSVHIPLGRVFSTILSKLILLPSDKLSFLEDAATETIMVLALVDLPLCIGAWIVQVDVPSRAVWGVNNMLFVGFVIY